MRYKDAVAEARRLVKQSEEDQWRLAELTWTTTQDVTQRKWATDVGVDFRTVGRWRQIWQHKIEHVADGRTYAETEAIIRGSSDGESLRQTESIRTVHNLPPEKKAEVVEELLDDADQKVRHAAIKALDKHYDRERELRQRETPTALQSAFDAAIELLVRQRAITAANKTATDLVMSGAEFGDTTDNVAIADWQINALNILRTAISGRSGMDAELAEILKEG